MGLTHYPKQDGREYRYNAFQMQSQALGKGFTQTGRRTGNKLLGVNSFLCSQLEDQLMSCRRPRSASLMSTSVTAAGGIEGPSTPTTSVLAIRRVASTPAR